MIAQSDSWGVWGVLADFTEVERKRILALPSREREREIQRFIKKRDEEEKRIAKGWPI